MSSNIKITINGTAFDYPKDLVNKYLIGNEAFTDAYSYDFPQDSAEDMNNNLRMLMSIDNEDRTIKVNGITEFLEFIDKMFRLDQHSLDILKGLSDDFEKIVELYQTTCSIDPEAALSIGTWFNAEFNETYFGLYTAEETRNINLLTFDANSTDENKLSVRRTKPFWALLKLFRLPERIQEGIFKTVDKMLSKGIETMNIHDLEKKDFTNNLFNFIVYKFYTGLLPESHEPIEQTTETDE